MDQELYNNVKKNLTVLEDTIKAIDDKINRMQEHRKHITKKARKLKREMNRIEMRCL